MKARKSWMVAASLAQVLGVSIAMAQETRPAAQDDPKAEVTALVDKAAALVAEKGEAAFPELRKKGSEWTQGEMYVFVDRMDGMAMVHPTLEGQNAADIKDSDGTPIWPLMLKAVESSDSGWAEYMWPKPGRKDSSKKTSYLRKVKVGETTYIVGAGVFLD